MKKNNFVTRLSIFTIMLMILMQAGSAVTVSHWASQMRPGIFGENFALGNFSFRDSLGIGTSDPQNALEVIGTINATAIKVGDVSVCQQDGTNCPATTSSSEAGGWSNTTVRTTTLLDVNISGSIFINASTHHVGIGTASPTTALLQIEAGTGNQGLYVHNDVTGTYAAHIFNDQITGGHGLLVQTDGTAGGTYAFSIQTGTYGNLFRAYGDHVFSENLAIGTGYAGSIPPSDSLIIAGNVGIGTTSPQNALEVIGTINATAIKVGDVAVCQQDGTNCPAGASASGNTTEEIQDAAGAAAGNHLTYDDAGDALNVDDDWIDIGGDTTGALTSDLNIDADTLVVSYDDNRVGIGTASPGEALEVAGNINVTTGNDICITGGNCLSDVAAEADTLATVTGRGATTTTTINISNTDNPGITIGDGSIGYLKIGSTGWYDDGTYFSPLGTRPIYVRSSTDFTFLYATNTFLGDTSGDHIRLRDNEMYGDDWIINDGGNGNWGINTTTPSQLLDVHGNMNVSNANATIFFADGGYIKDNGTMLILGHT